MWLISRNCFLIIFTCLLVSFIKQSDFIQCDYFSLKKLNNKHLVKKLYTGTSDSYKKITLCDTSILASFKNLVSLKISYGKLYFGTGFFNKLPKLKTINLSTTLSNSLPKDIEESNIENITIVCAKAMKEVPQEVFRIKGIKSIYLANLKNDTLLKLELSNSKYNFIELYSFESKTINIQTKSIVFIDKLNIIGCKFDSLFLFNGIKIKELCFDFESYNSLSNFLNNTNVKIEVVDLNDFDYEFIMSLDFSRFKSVKFFKVNNKLKDFELTEIKKKTNNQTPQILM